MPCTPGSRRREELWRFTTDLATEESPTQLGAPNPHHRTRSRKSGAALLHDIKSGVSLLARPYLDAFMFCASLPGTPAFS